MAPDLLMAIDQGTTGSTVLVLDKDLKVLGRANREFPQIFPKPGWVEHDPDEIWKSVEGAAKAALEQAGDAGGERIAAIGITNQRETFLLWDRESGKPYHNAIVWQCRRSAPICDEIRAAGKADLLTATTGLVPDPYFSGTKVTWLLREKPEIREAAESGKAAFGTIDTYLVWRLSGGAAHVTDATNASRTLFMNLASLEWDDGMLEMLEAPKAMLPKIVGCAEEYAVTKGVGFLPDGVPIAGMAGDQQAALIGQACFETGQAKCTFGTGAFLLMNIGEQPTPSNNKLLTTVAWKYGDKVAYALEGSAFIAGAAVQWLRDGLQLFENAADVEKLAASVDSSEGVVFVPALAGLGAPHWRAEARGLLSGITRGTTKAHVARAVQEGIAMQNVDVLKAMVADSGAELKELRVDGGAAANNMMMQFQADMLGCTISRPAMLETTALGAAFLAGLGCGMFASLGEVSAAWEQEREFTPRMEAEEREEFLALWESAVAKA